MADRIASKSVAPERITTIPVWSQRDEIYPTPRDANPLRKALGLEEAFVAMYSGNLGLAHSFDEFIEAARRLRDRPDIVFLFVGDGPRLAEVKAARDREDLTNIRLLDYVPRSQLQASLALADVHLISMRPEMTGIVVPGKLYGVMAAGRPAVFVGPEHCESADTIRDAGCGITITPGDADGLVAALLRLASNPSLARRMGEKGRSAFLTAHDRKLCCAQWHELIGNLVARPETARAASDRADTTARHARRRAAAPLRHAVSVSRKLAIVHRQRPRLSLPSEGQCREIHDLVLRCRAGSDVIRASGALGRARARSMWPRSRPSTTGPSSASSRNTCGKTPRPTIATRPTPPSSTRRSSTTGSARPRNRAGST